MFAGLMLPNLRVGGQHPLDAGQRGDDALVVTVLRATNVFVQKPASTHSTRHRRLNRGEFLVGVAGTAIVLQGLFGETLSRVHMQNSVSQPESESASP